MLLLKSQCLIVNSKISYVGNVRQTSYTEHVGQFGSVLQNQFIEMCLFWLAQSVIGVFVTCLSDILELVLNV